MKLLLAQSGFPVSRVPLAKDGSGSGKRLDRRRMRPAVRRPPGLVPALFRNAWIFGKPMAGGISRAISARCKVARAGLSRVAERNISRFSSSMREACGLRCGIFHVLAANRQQQALIRRVAGRECARKGACLRLCF